MKSYTFVGMILATVILTLSFGVVGAETSNMTMSVGTNVPNNNASDNMTVPMNMSMPMNMTMPAMKMTDGGVSIFMQNVNLEIITMQNVTYVNAIPPLNKSDA